MNEPTPSDAARLRAEQLAQGLDAHYQGRSAREAFSAIYAHRIWGGDGREPFYSGEGSRNPKLFVPYLNAVKHAFADLGKLDAVDLGCGDFFVGAQLRHRFERFVACDVVPEMIEHHKTRWAGLGIDFRVLDMVADDLPSGDVVFIRQVLQHLSNAQIMAVVKKLAGYRYLVLTEHHPPMAGFLPNIDKPMGADIRAQPGIDSGIVLTAEPFCLKVRNEKILCEVPSDGGIIRTLLYEL